MTILHDEAKRWPLGLLPLLFGVILLSGICVATVRLLGIFAVYFMPMYVVLYLQHLERHSRFTLWAAAVLTVVLAVLARI